MSSVKNKKVLGRLAWARIRAEKGRTGLAVFAIVLTALMLSAIFTLLFGANQAMENDQFRQVGSTAHGELKNLSNEELTRLQTSPTFEETGLRVIAGLAVNPGLEKIQVEVSYMDDQAAQWSFIKLDKGHLPQAKTKEIALDEEVLKALGLPADLGSPIPLDIRIGESTIRETFTLSGTFPHADKVLAYQALIAKDQVSQLLEKAHLPKDEALGLGKNQLSVKLRSARHIEKSLQEAIQATGYQSSQPDQADYIAYGVNWGYTQSKLSRMEDPVVGLGLLFILLAVIACSGLVIYHIFLFSVSDDTRFYGLLKTIGTTPRQLRRLVHIKALFLALAGVLPGLFAGWLAGSLCLPKLLSLIQLDLDFTLVADPLIFLMAFLFTLATVYLATIGPGRLAAKAAPIEAVKFQDLHLSAGRLRQAHPLSAGRLGLIQLRSHRKRLILTALSLALTLWLFTNAVNLSNSFSEEKYLSKIPTDFVIADARLFVPANSHAAPALTNQDIQAVQPFLPQESWGSVYLPSHSASERLPAKDLRRLYKENYGYSDEDLKAYFKDANTDGQAASPIQLYGMTNFTLQKAQVLEGDLAPLTDPKQKAIAALIRLDDYGQPIEKSHRLRTGDQVQICLGPPDGARFESYTVCATLALPYSLTARYHFAEGYVLDAAALQKADPSAQVQLLAFDAPKKDQAVIEEGLKRLSASTSLGYESKAGARADFIRLQKTLSLFAGLIVAVMATITLANYINTVLTGLLVRRREFALLQAVGMTKKQVYQMVVTENLLTLGLAIGLAGFGLLASNRLITEAVNGAVWFADWQASLVPLLYALPFFLAIALLLPLFGLHRTQESLMTILKRSN